MLLSPMLSMLSLQLNIVYFGMFMFSLHLNIVYFGMFVWVLPPISSAVKYYLYKNCNNLIL